MSAITSKNKLENVPIIKVTTVHFSKFLLWIPKDGVGGTPNYDTQICIIMQISRDLQHPEQLSCSAY